MNTSNPGRAFYHERDGMIELTIPANDVAVLGPLGLSCPFIRRLASFWCLTRHIDERLFDVLLAKVMKTLEVRIGSFVFGELSGSLAYKLGT